MRLLFLTLCCVAVAQGQISAAYPYSTYARPTYQYVPQGVVQPRNYDSETTEGRAVPQTRYTKTSHKSEKSESFQSQKSHHAESSSFSSSSSGGYQAAPTSAQSGYQPSRAALGGSAGQAAAVTQVASAGPRQYGGISQKAHVQQTAGGYGSGAIQQNANIHQAASGGSIDQNANVAQFASYREAPVRGADIRQTTNVHQHASPTIHNLHQNVNVRQSAGQGIQGGASGAVGGRVGADVPTAIGETNCGSNSVYCQNVRDEGFYPSTDARGHFYRCAHCTPHFFRCGPGTAYHVTYRSCL